MPLYSAARWCSSTRCVIVGVSASDTCAAGSSSVSSTNDASLQANTRRIERAITVRCWSECECGPGVGLQCAGRAADTADEAHHRLQQRQQPRQPVCRRDLSPDRIQHRERQRTLRHRRAQRTEQADALQLAVVVEVADRERERRRAPPQQQRREGSLQPAHVVLQGGALSGANGLYREGGEHGQEVLGGVVADELPAHRSHVRQARHRRHLSHGLLLRFLSYLLRPPSGTGCAIARKCLQLSLV